MSAPRGAVVGAVAALAAGAATSVLAAAFARRVVTPDRRLPDDTDVLAVSEAAVVLAGNAATTARGVYGLRLPGGGHARVGEVISVQAPVGAPRRPRSGTAGTVTRALLGVDRGTLRPGPARWSGWYHDGDPSSVGLEHQDVTVASEVGGLPAWFVPAASPAGGGDATTWAVLVHGRGATREECLRALPLLQRLGVAALVPTYRNDADAPASSAGSYALGDTEWQDVEAAIVHALGHGARHVVLMGWSMGGAICLQALSRSWTATAVRAVVLDSPVVDWRDVLDHHAALNHVPRTVGRYGLGMLSSPLARVLVGSDGPVDLARLDWVTRAAELRTPVLLMHGSDDTYVPVGPSRTLAAARPDLVTFAEFAGAEHCREWNTDPERWEREMARFLLQHL